MSAVTKADIAKTITGKHDINLREASSMVDIFFNEICSGLTSGHEVKVSGFGNFDLSKKNARPGRNPKTGEEYTISSRYVVIFHPGPKLKNTIKKLKF